MYFHLVIWVHFGHHSFFQKVEGQHLQHVKLMGHFCFDWSISSNDVLKHKNEEQFAGKSKFGGKTEDIIWQVPRWAQVSEQHSR